MTSDRDRLAALLHDALPDETNWRSFFRREDEPDGWNLVITRKLSEHLADRLLAAGVTLAAPSPRDFTMNETRTAWRCPACGHVGSVPGVLTFAAPSPDLAALRGALEDAIDQLDEAPITLPRARRGDHDFGLGDPSFVYRRHALDAIQRVLAAAPTATEQMYGRLAAEYQAEPPVPDHGGGVAGDRFDAPAQDIDAEYPAPVAGAPRLDVDALMRGDYDDLTAGELRARFRDPTAADLLANVREDTRS